MKHIYSLLALSIGSTLTSWSQPAPVSIYNAKCECQDIKSAGFIDSTDNYLSHSTAVKIIAELISLMPFRNEAEREKFSKMEVASPPCATSAHALLCPDKRKAILYNQAFMSKLAQEENSTIARNPAASDYFILAHELGHLYFKNHHHTDDGQRLQKYVSNIASQLGNSRPSHLNELHADGMALLLMYRRKYLYHDAFMALRTMRSHDEAKNRIDTENYPSPDKRKKIAEVLWQEIEKRHGDLTATGLTSFIDTSYSDELLRDYKELKKQQYLDTQFIIDIQSGKTNFKLATAEPLPGQLKFGVGLGLRVDYHNWQQTHGVSLSAQGSYLAFNTLTSQTDGYRTVESYQYFFATVEPSYSLHSIGFRPSPNFVSQRKGWFISVGGRMNIPVYLKYKNYEANLSDGSSLNPRWSINPSIRIGTERWVYPMPGASKRGGYQLYLQYTPLKLHFQGQSTDSKLIHLVSIGFGYSLW